jgi:hypothetical protein
MGKTLEMVAGNPSDERRFVVELGLVIPSAKNFARRPIIQKTAVDRRWWMVRQNDRRDNDVDGQATAQLRRPVDDG